jgi:hypothetical protein
MSGSATMLALIRRTAAIPVLAASAVLLAACGGGHSTSSTTGSQPPRATTAQSSSPAAQATTAQARAFAAAVNLKAGDLPGFRATAVPKHPDAVEKHLEPELARCVGSLGAHSGAVEASSKDYERGASIVTQSVSSQVTVARSAALAARELSAIRSGQLQTCLSHYFNQLLKSQSLHGATVAAGAPKRGSPPAPGSAGSFGLRFTEIFTLHRLRIPFYVDILGFVKGPAEVSLFTFGVPRQFPAALEERLFSLLVERANAHKP